MDADERYRLYTTYSGPLGLISVIFCGLAVITSYIYPQQRRFPNIVLVWTCIGDLALGLYVSMKWLPGPVRTHFTDKATLHPSLCYFSTYLQWTMLEAASMLSLLLAYTLYLTIVKGIDLHELRSKYYYPYLAVVWIPTICIPFMVFAERNSKIDAGLCKVISPLVVLFRTLNLLIPLAVQLVLMVLVLKVVIEVSLAVKNNLGNISSTRAILWLSCARFFGAQLNEFTVWLPIMYWDILNMKGIPASNGLIIFSAISPGFMAFNGIIVMAGNKQLRLSCLKAYIYMRARFGMLPKAKVSVGSTETTMESPRNSTKLNILISQDNVSHDFSEEEIL
eukprot:Phypoly_transcript_04349.p1 GENE.Phypoly_transcript_04349~~Phypoly_transcript_04349.p1  ORF type:complete len:336 (+),score=29.77 Phypoly_transcript_04349:1171-2178(+)